jgi:putative transcriptional regulator
VAGVTEAATKGLDVLLLSANDALSSHTAKLQEDNLSYEVVDAAEE